MVSQNDTIHQHYHDLIQEFKEVFNDIGVLIVEKKQVANAEELADICGVEDRLK